LNRSIRKVRDLRAQRIETYRYWQTRTVPERMKAIEEMVREAYFATGVDLDRQPSDRRLIRVTRPNWKAA
jgi:dimeric dUTPase (all-alpha-NTP-PPase superfamily)